MNLLHEYCISELVIDGLKTFIISPEHYEDLLHDGKINEWLWGKMRLVKRVIVVLAVTNTLEVTSEHWIYLFGELKM